MTNKCLARRYNTRTGTECTKKRLVTRRAPGRAEADAGRIWRPAAASLSGALADRDGYTIACGHGERVLCAVAAVCQATRRALPTSPRRARQKTTARQRRRWQNYNRIACQHRFYRPLLLFSNTIHHDALIGQLDGLPVTAGAENRRQPPFSRRNVRPERKSLTEQRAVNRPLTEYAQFFNQSEPQRIGRAQYRASSPKPRTT